MAKVSKASAPAPGILQDAELLSALCHELRGPLGTIGTWVHVLAQGTPDPAMQRRALQAIERGVRAQASLLDQLSDFSHALGGGLSLDPTAVDLKELARDVVDAARAQASDAGVLLKLEIQAAEVVVRGERGRLRMIAAILVTSAVRAAPREGQVVLEVARNGAGGELAVTGLRHGPAGTLGVALARTLAERQGGCLELADAGASLRATFRMPAAADSI